MSLGLDVVRTKGRAAKPVLSAQVRELTPEDLVLLSTERGVQPPPLTEIRSQHHALARALAAGYSSSEAATLTGYSLSRVSILKSDPAFQELYAVYEKSAMTAFEATVGKLGTLAELVADEMISRVRDEPKKIVDKDLTEFGKFAADRVGLGPQSKSTNVNVNVDLSSKLEAARRRAGLLEGTVLPPPPEEESVA